MTLAELKAYGQMTIQTTQEDYYNKMLAAATKLVYDYIGVESGSVSEDFFDVGNIVALTHHPAGAVSSVTSDGKVLSSEDYIFNIRQGSLRLLKGNGSKRLTVVYTCSFTEDDLVKACIAHTVKSIDAQRQHAGIQSLTFSEGGNETYSQTMLSNPIMSVLDAYRGGHVL